MRRKADDWRAGNAGASTSECSRTSFVSTSSYRSTRSASSAQSTDSAFVQPSSPRSGDPIHVVQASQAVSCSRQSSRAFAAGSRSAFTKKSVVSTARRLSTCLATSLRRSTAAPCLPSRRHFCSERSTSSKPRQRASEPRLPHAPIRVSMTPSSSSSRSSNFWGSRRPCSSLWNTRVHGTGRGLENRVAIGCRCPSPPSRRSSTQGADPAAKPTRRATGSSAFVATPTMARSRPRVLATATHRRTAPSAAWAVVVGAESPFAQERTCSNSGRSLPSSASRLSWGTTSFKPNSNPRLELGASSELSNASE
mmetsp:Transcript_10617/g.38997  ORF Transcript_10617/g.38997 Transcript_10617/m.38997 type:complete len:309 (-) Transcript_10617:1128-2054(-)